MGNREILIAVFLRQSASRAALPGATLTQVQILEVIQAGQFTSSAENGTTVIETEEAGGRVRFEVPKSLGAAEIMIIAELAMQQLEGARRVTRLRAGFGKARL